MHGVFESCRLVYVKMERHRNAVSEFREAARTNPKFADAHNNLGLTLLRTNRLDEALASFREAARVSAAQSEADPSDAFARAKDDAIRNGPLGERIAEVTELLEMADQFMLDHLKQVCEVPLCQAVRDYTVEELLRVAEGYNALQLQAVCRHHIRNAPHLQEGNSANPSDG